MVRLVGMAKWWLRGGGGAEDVYLHHLPGAADEKGEKVLAIATLQNGHELAVSSEVNLYFVRKPRPKR